ncbi:unnamed protein product [Chironomus riparius]|uniref:Uncharacterized protein n=1 Tax=Chironomus riparius TaxID=315576 RepID=A0A9N9WVH9_9DIPT|nr:unnamed protein product [Chironomus riparius]
MKLNVLTGIAIISCVNAIPIKYDSLNNIYKNLIPTIDGFATNVDVDCVESKLNLAKNGNKIVKSQQGFMLVHYAAFLCSEELTKSRIDEKLTEVRQVITLLEPRTEKCLKISLWELEPDSPLLDNFNKNVIADEMSSCKKSKDFIEFSNMMDEAWTVAEELLGSEITKCRNPVAEKKNQFTFLALVDETRPAVKNDELDKYIKAETALQDAFLHCALVPVENMAGTNVVDGNGQEKD